VESLEGQKKWLMGRVFECEVALEDSEQARAGAEVALQERDAAIADLEAKVLRQILLRHAASASVWIMCQVIEALLHTRAFATGWQETPC
jgi:hypothetical protein